MSGMLTCMLCLFDGAGSHLDHWLLLRVLAEVQNDSIPIELLNQDKQLRKDIFILEKNNYKNDSSLHILLDKKAKLEKITDSIKLYTPNYIKRTANNIISLKSIQQQLHKNEAILEYIVFDIDHIRKPGYENAVYGMYITKSNTNLFKVKSTSCLEELSQQYSISISKPFTNKIDKNKFDIISKDLYNILIPSEIQKIIKN